jgi:hypothetical protein
MARWRGCEPMSNNTRNRGPCRPWSRAECRPEFGSLHAAALAGGDRSGRQRPASEHVDRLTNKTVNKTGIAPKRCALWPENSGSPLWHRFSEQCRTHEPELKSFLPSTKPNFTFDFERVFFST